jgi:cell division protein FtsX
MDITWYRDLSITILGFAGAVVSIVLAIAFLRLQRSANSVLKELKVASILARDTAELVHDGVQPVASVLGVLRAIGHGTERSSADEKKRRR